MKIDDASGKYERFEELRLLPGHRLQLDFDGYSQDRVKSLLVGYNSFSRQHCIISTLPFNSSAAVSFNVGSELTIRLFVPHLGCACAFRSKVNRIVREPYAFLYLDMPKKIVLGEVRSTVRSNVNLRSELFYAANFQEKHDALIDDLSLGGARVVVTKTPLKSGDPIQIRAQAIIGDVERDLTINGLVRSKTVDSEEEVLGVEFVKLDDDTKIALYGLVMSHIYG